MYFNDFVDFFLEKTLITDILTVRKFTLLPTLAFTEAIDWPPLLDCRVIHFYGA